MLRPQRGGETARSELKSADWAATWGSEILSHVTRLRFERRLVVTPPLDGRYSLQLVWRPSGVAGLARQIVTAPPHELETKVQVGTCSFRSVSEACRC